jgi:hypothetical protein
VGAWPLPICDLHKCCDIHVLSAGAVAVTLYCSAVSRMHERSQVIWDTASVREPTCYNNEALNLTQRAHTPQVLNMPPNTDSAHNKHSWTIACSFNQARFSTPWWWILRDLKHDGVIFNVWFILEFYITQFFSCVSSRVHLDCLASVECIFHMICTFLIKGRWEHHQQVRIDLSVA